MKLGECCNIMMGQAPRGEFYNSIGEGLPLLAGAGDLGDIAPKATRYSTSSSKVNEVGDIILCIRATIGKKNWADKKYCLGRGVAAVSVINPQATDINYIWHFLTAKNQELQESAKGATFKQIVKDDIERIKIDLPPISVQRSIAAILDKVDAICRKRKECIKMLDELVKARFVEMFGDVNKNSHGFQSALGKELFIFSSGKFLPSSKRLVSGIPVYGGNGKVWYTDTHLVDYPTIIIGRVGAYCGNINLVTEPVWITDNAIYIKELKKQCLDLNFLYYLMYFLNFNKYADYSGQPKITQDPLNNINYIIPPLEKQKLFSDFTKQVEYAKSSMQAQLQETETLKAALMQQYFSQPSQEKICA